MPIKTLLIANRGEIACRIIRTCQSLGIRTVAVYSQADSGAMHVDMADHAVEIGPAPVRESYLNADRILTAAREAAVDAIHPGYGFLSENGDFAEAVIGAGLIWVGPAPATIRAMGDKERAREIATQAGVPVLPGSRRFVADDLEGLEAEGQIVGYPLLVKAAAGGGGIGMRRVDSLDQLHNVVEATQRMAVRAFSDGSVYLERYVGRARHVEVQIFGYGDGSGVHLYDRDCSVQRRFQKVIEEAPAPNLPREVRNALHQTALALVRHQNYSGAGTVEFVYDVERSEAFFLEMNTRLQVEHPVTEMITGIDLVAWQIKQAEGTLDPVSQSAVRAHGHAVEVRLYAERPDKKFLPSPGTIERVSWPPETRNVRVDAGVEAGTVVTPHYDPLLGKISAYGATRDGALAEMEQALSDAELAGVHHNVQFLIRILRHPDFRRAALSTSLVNDVLADSAIVS